MAEPRQVMITLALLLLLVEAPLSIRVEYDGLPLPGTTVSVTDGATRRTEVSNVDGLAVFPGLSPGAYKVTAELSGLKTVKREVVYPRDRSVTLKMRIRRSEAIVIACPGPMLPEPFTFTITPWTIQGFPMQQ